MTKACWLPRRLGGKLGWGGNASIVLTVMISIAACLAAICLPLPVQQTAVAGRIA